MSDSGPRNFYCHQCNTRTRVSAEEFTCASCGSGFIEEIVEADLDESREGGAGPNPDDPWAHDSEFEADAQEMPEHSMTDHVFQHAMGPRNQEDGQRGGSGGASRELVRTRARSTRRRGLTSTTRRNSITGIFFGGAGQSTQFLQDLLSNLMGGQVPGNFRLLVEGPSGSNVMHGELGDYAWGRGGLDTIVTRLLNQTEGAGPPHMEKEDIKKLPVIKVTQDQVDQKVQCSVCWEDFTLDESVSQLRCEHIFHKDCINPWLELHATCPVCRKPLNEAAAAHSRQAQNESGSEGSFNVGVNSSGFFGQASPSSSSSQNQFSFGFPLSSSSSNTDPSRSNAFPQPTSTSTNINGESANGGHNSPIPPLVDVSSSSSPETGENYNSSGPNGPRSSLPTADSSTRISTRRLNTNAGSNAAASETSTSTSAPTDFQEFDLE